MNRHLGTWTTESGRDRDLERISSTSPLSDTSRRVWLFLLASLCMALISSAAAMADQAKGPSSRAARLSNVEGAVRLLRGTSTEFQQALANMPLTEGSRLVTSNDGRAEVQFEDGSVARITPNSSLSLNVLRRNSDGSVVTEVELLGGLGYFELKPPAGQQLDAVRFGTNLLTAGSNAVIRINRDTDPAEVAVLSGDAHIAGGTQFNVDVHANETIRFDGTDSSRYYLGQSVGGESWDQWNIDRDQAMSQAAAQETTVAAEQGDPDNPAWSDLDASGSWYSVPGYGNVWTPASMGAGWDPYGSGSWAYYPGYGYTWVSGYPWGWLPYRCGGWNYFNSFGWGWMPGGCGLGYGSWGTGVAVYSSPPGYMPPARPVIKGPVARLASNQRVISVDRGLHAHSNAPVTIAGVNTPPRAIVYAGQRLEPISAKFNADRGTMWGNALNRAPAQPGMPSGTHSPTSPGSNGPWFVQGAGNAAPPGAAHTVQPYPAAPARSLDPSIRSGTQYQAPPWSNPERPLPPSIPSSGMPAGGRSAPPSPPHSSAPLPSRSSPPSAPSAPASHSSPGPSSSGGGHSH